MIDRDGIQFSDNPCSSCGWRHQVDAFKPGARVRVVGEHAVNYSREPSHVGRLGRVVEWSCYSGYLYVRVQVDPATDAERSYHLRRNYCACELEHA